MKFNCGINRPKNHQKLPIYTGISQIKKDHRDWGSSNKKLTLFITIYPVMHGCDGIMLGESFFFFFLAGTEKLLKIDVKLDRIE